MDELQERVNDFLNAAYPRDENFIESGAMQCPSREQLLAKSREIANFLTAVHKRTYVRDVHRHAVVWWHDRMAWAEKIWNAYFDGQKEVHHG